MNEFEDFIDKLQFEQPDVNSENAVEVICGYNEEGQLLCETSPAAEVSSDSQSSSDNELEDVDQEFVKMESLFAPFTSILSMFDSFNPYNYISYDEPCHENAGQMVELADGVEEGDYYIGDDGLGDVGDSGYFYNLLDGFTGEDIEFYVEFDDDFKDLGMFGYAGVGNDDIVFYFDEENEYAPFDSDIMNVRDELAFGEAIEWQDQVFGALSFVVLALVLTKVVLFCTRSRSRTLRDQKTPLLTVSVEKQETTKGGETGSYVPPPESVMTKAVVAKKMEKGPYIVFI